MKANATHLLRFIILTVVFMLAASLPSAAQEPSERQLSSGPAGQIAFVSDRDGNREIYRVNADGSGLVNLTNHPANDGSPAWSPDGQLIAFNSHRFQGHLDIFVVNPDGSNIRNLTRDVNYAFGPVWSPDSRWLAFMSAGEGLYIAQIGSGQLTRLSELSHTAIGADWGWSPGGDYLTFATGTGRDFDIYIVARDGSGQTKLIEHPAHDANPVWRPAVAPPPTEESARRTYVPNMVVWRRASIPPTPSLIAYIGRDGNIWLINSDGTGKTRLTHDAAKTTPLIVYYTELKWSPDGRNLAYIRTEHAGTQSHRALRMYRLQTRSHQELVREPYFNRFDWAPDSASIVYGPAIPEGYFLDEPDPNEPIRGIWQVDVNTRETFELVGPELGFPLARPRWSHDGRYLSFEQIQHHEGAGGLVIYDMEAGTYPRNQGALFGSIDWSPLANLLVYDRVVYEGEAGSQIWITDAIGANTFWLTPPRQSTGDMWPQFSPTAKHVAFLRIRPDSFSSGPIWIVDADAFYGDGSTELQLTTFDVPCCAQYSWAPDGQRLVVSRGGYEEEDLFIVDLTGNLRYVTEGHSPAWQPAE